MMGTLLNLEEYNIIYRIGVDEMSYKDNVNVFEKETGLTIKNIYFPIEDFYWIKLAKLSKTFSCGNVIENIFGALKKEVKDIDGSLIIVDFEGVEEVGDTFYESYTKILLESSSKIITINMNTAITNAFGIFIEENIQEVEE